MTGLTAALGFVPAGWLGYVTRMIAPQIDEVVNTLESGICYLLHSILLTSNFTGGVKDPSRVGRSAGPHPLRHEDSQR